ncbi:MAG: vWA domain-containing protein, partial [Hyphomicrobiales bacterium]
MLIVLCRMVIPAGAADDVVLVLDASRSMWGTVAKKPKYMMVHDAFARALDKRSAIPGVGLISFGNRSPSSCSDVNALIAPGASDHGRFLSTIGDLKPWGLTPIAESLRRASGTFRADAAGRSIILITDGTENCRGDPCAVARTLKQQSPSLAINVIALSVPEAAHKHLSCVAENTDGLFQTASTQGELDIAVRAALDWTPGAAPATPVADGQAAEPLTPSLALLNEPPPLPRRNPKWRQRLAAVA